MFVWNVKRIHGGFLPSERIIAKQMRNDLNLLLQLMGYAAALLFGALRYKPEGRWFDSRWCYWNFSLI